MRPGGATTWGALVLRVRAQELAEKPLPCRRPGQPEVEQLCVAALGYEDGGRLDVAMDDLLGSTASPISDTFTGGLFGRLKFLRDANGLVVAAQCTGICRRRR